MIRDLFQKTRQAEPTPFHDMLAVIAIEGRLQRLFTQNVDEIDTKLPSLATVIPLEEKGPWPTTIQLHGGLDKMVCCLCGKVSDLEVEVFKGEEAPLC